MIIEAGPVHNGYFPFEDKWHWKSSVQDAVMAMEAEHEKLKVLVKEVKVLSAKMIGSVAIHEFEADVIIMGQRKRISDSFSVQWFLKWNVIRHWNSVNKSNEFLNTNLGKRWLGYLIQECKPYYLYGERKF